jgi:hypothetical protein
MHPYLHKKCQSILRRPIVFRGIHTLASSSVKSLPVAVSIGKKRGRRRFVQQIQILSHDCVVKSWQIALFIGGRIEVDG